MIKKFTVELPDKTEEGKLAMSNKLVSRFLDCDITWLHDGTAIITTERDLGVIKQTIKDFKLKPKENTHPEIKHRADSKGKEPLMEKLTKSDIQS